MLWFNGISLNQSESSASCLRPVTHSAVWRVRLYFGSHVNRLELTHCLRDTHVSENVCLLEIEPKPIFHATRKRVGSVSRQNIIGKDVYMSFRH